MFFEKNKQSVTYKKILKGTSSPSPSLKDQELMDMQILLCWFCVEFKLKELSVKNNKQSIF